MTGRLVSKVVVVTGGGTSDRRRVHRPVLAPARPALPGGGKLWSNGPAAPPADRAANPDEKE
jgi:hypothetical protein